MGSFYEAVVEGLMPMGLPRGQNCFCVSHMIDWGHMIDWVLVLTVKWVVKFRKWSIVLNVVYYVPVGLMVALEGAASQKQMRSQL